MCCILHGIPHKTKKELFLITIFRKFSFKLIGIFFFFSTHEVLVTFTTSFEISDCGLLLTPRLSQLSRDSVAQFTDLNEESGIR